MYALSNEVNIGTRWHVASRQGAHEAARAALDGVNQTISNRRLS